MEIGQSSFSHWIDGPSIHQSGQLEEVGRCGRIDFKKACTGRERGVVNGRFPKVEVLRGFLIEQRAKHWASLCHRFENTRERPHWFGRRLEICINKDCSIIPPSLASADSFINNYMPMKTAQKLHNPPSAFPDSAPLSITGICSYKNVPAMLFLTIAFLCCHTESPTQNPYNRTLSPARRDELAKIRQRQLANAVHYIWETGEDKFAFRYFHTGFWESCEKHSDGENKKRMASNIDTLAARHIFNYAVALFMDCFFH